MKIYKLTFDNKQDFIDKTAHLRIQPTGEQEEVDVSTLSWNENVHSIVEGITVIIDFMDAHEEQPMMPIYSDKYHVDMILSEPSNMEQYIDKAVKSGHYAHGYVGCELEVAMPL